MEPTLEQIEIGTLAWFAAARTLWINTYGLNRPCPIPAFEQLDEDGQRFFRAVTRRTLIAADPENVRKVMERN